MDRINECTRVRRNRLNNIMVKNCNCKHALINITLRRGGATVDLNAITRRELQVRNALEEMNIG